MDWEPTQDEIRIMDHERDQRYYHEQTLKKNRKEGKGAVLLLHEDKVKWKWDCPLCRKHNFFSAYFITEFIRDTIYCTYCGREQPLIEHQTVLEFREKLIDQKKAKKATEKAEKKRKLELAELVRLKNKYGDEQL